MVAARTPNVAARGVTGVAVAVAAVGLAQRDAITGVVSALRVHGLSVSGDCLRIAVHFRGFWRHCVDRGIVL